MPLAHRSSLERLLADSQSCVNAESRRTNEASYQQATVAALSRALADACSGLCELTNQSRRGIFRMWGALKRRELKCGWRLNRGAAAVDRQNENMQLKLRLMWVLKKCDIHSCVSTKCIQNLASLSGSFSSINAGCSYCVGVLLCAQRSN